MIQELKRQVVELPDRQEISLCEAVTAVIYGEARDVKEQYHCYEESMGKIESESGLGFFDKPTPAEKQTALNKESPANEKTAKLNELLERLREAAYAGRIKFRAIKEGEDPANGYRDVDPLYFYVKPFFNWSQDVIFNREDESATVWYFVHLDREQFASLLREMGLSVRQSTISVQQSIDSYMPADKVTYKTGDPGRGSSKHIYMAEAQRRLDIGDVPDEITEFSEQLVDWLKRTHPLAAPPKPRSVENRIRPLWHKRTK